MTTLTTESPLPENAVTHIPSPQDTDNMLRRVVRLPDDLLAGWRRYQGALREGPIFGAGAAPVAFDADVVVVAGMGGSAIAADLAAELLADRLRRPMVPLRGPDLPAWVGPRCLFVASSYSGNTAETLAAYGAAQDAGAPCVAISSGGSLRAAAEADGIPILVLEPGSPPRAALGQSLAALFAVIHAAGLARDLESAVDQAVDGAQRGLSPTGELPEADTVGQALVGRLPVVYAPARFEAVARRWCNQINENAKTAAFWGVVPEINHNAVEGYERPNGLAGSARVVWLQPASGGPDFARRKAATEALLKSAGLDTLTVGIDFGSHVADGMGLVTFGDLVSLRLAHHLGVDPTPVPTLQRLKERLQADS